MKNLILILTLFILFICTTKSIETMSVNLNCKITDNNYICKEKTTFSSITTNLNEVLNYYKESAQKKYNKFKNDHDKATSDIKSLFEK